MSLERKDVDKVALLGRLLLNDAQLSKMTEQLGRIVGYVEQLGELDTTNVEPMAHALEMRNVFADDIVAASLSREAALSNAPKRDSECYRVPAVLGE